MSRHEPTDRAVAYPVDLGVDDAYVLIVTGTQWDALAKAIAARLDGTGRPDQTERTALVSVRNAMRQAD